MSVKSGPKREAPDTRSFSVGEAVYAQWPGENKGPWHVGKIESCNADNTTFCISFPDVARVHNNVPEAYVRPQAEGKPGEEPVATQCCSTLLDIVTTHPDIKPQLTDICSAIHSAPDPQAEVKAMLITLGAGPPLPAIPAVGAGGSRGMTVSPPPPPPGGPGTVVRPQAPPKKDDEIFLGDARTLSKLAPNLEVAQKLRSQLEGVVEAQQPTTPRGTPSEQAAAASIESNLLGSTFFMPSFADADEKFKEFITSRLVYKYGGRDLESRGIINWAVERQRISGMRAFRSHNL